VGTYDSAWDLRQPWATDDLKAQIRKVLRKNEGKTTRQVAEATESNHEQARRLLVMLWGDGEAVPEGDRRARLWYRT